MEKCYICEISEEDFRKLDLYGYSKDKKISLVKEYDDNVEYWIKNGYKSDYEDLQYPVTIAIHKEPETEPETYYEKLNYMYFDKFMNRFGGPQSYQLGMGIRHLYSTRDYFEAHGDYWRVKKNETKVIYRITIDPKRLEKFVLRHKEEIFRKFNDNHYIEELLDLDENGNWVSRGKYEIEKFSEHGTSIKKYEGD